MCPKGSGYYDNDGNWIKQNKPVDDTSGRFGIGTSFVQQNTNKAPTPELEKPGDIALSSTNMTPVSNNSAVKTAPGTGDPNRYCAICKISVTATAQMVTHLAGAKHKKNEAKLRSGQSSPPTTPVLQEPSSSPPSSFSQPKSYQPQSRKKKETISDCYNEPSRRKDFSIYRTPSGQYYCQHCNITSPNESQFATHITSKAHNKALKSKK